MTPEERAVLRDLAMRIEERFFWETKYYLDGFPYVPIRRVESTIPFPFGASSG